MGTNAAPARPPKISRACDGPPWQSAWQMCRTRRFSVAARSEFWRDRSDDLPRRRGANCVVPGQHASPSSLRFHPFDSDNYDARGLWPGQDARPSTGPDGPVPGPALVAVHDEPQQAWTLERLADTAGMSRTAFATRFRAVMDQPPGEYLFRLRMALARDGLQSGQSLKQIAAAVGYTPTSLSRALARLH